MTSNSIDSVFNVARFTRTLICSFCLYFTCNTVHIESCQAEEVTSQVIYPAFQSDNDTRYLDILVLLKTALEKTQKLPKYGNFDLRKSDTVMKEGRSLTEVQSANKINITWSSTSHKKEQRLHPIRIPLRKGLLGYRISLIQKKNQEKIRAVRSLKELQRFSIGQSFDWGDVSVYRNAGFNVVTGSSYEGLFFMLSSNRFELFPRGVNEIFSEWKTRKGKLPNLHIEETLLIYYPWPYYFFTAKHNVKLAERIEEGLNIMIKDGSFQEIFMRFNGDVIARANLKERRVFRLTNPDLPTSTPLQRKELWYNPLK